MKAAIRPAFLGSTEQTAAKTAAALNVNSTKYRVRPESELSALSLNAISETSKLIVKYAK